MMGRDAARGDDASVAGDFDRGYNSADMHLLRFMFVLITLCIATAAFSLGQTEAPGALNEKIRQADALQAKGSLGDARKIYESALQVLSSSKPSSQLGHVLNALSEVAASQGKYDEAIASAQRAADVYRGLGDKGGEASSLNYRGIAEVQEGLYPAAQATLSHALELSRRAGDATSEVRILNNLGTAYYFPGQYLEAIRAYQEAGKLVELHTSDDWSDYWRQITKINEATLYQRLGRYQIALAMYKQVGTSSKGLTASDRAHVLMNLGVLYRRLGDPWKALASYRSALDLYSQQHNPASEINVLTNLGIVYAMDLGDLETAQRFFGRSHARAKDTHDAREEMQAHLYMGETLLRKNDWKAGLGEFETALAQARTLGTTEEQWKALYGIGRGQELLGQPARAEVEYREAISIIESTRTRLQLSALRAEFLADKRDAYDALIALLLRENNVKDAFFFLERSRARTFQDRLVPSDSGKQLASPVPSLDEVRSYLDNSTVLLEYWASGSQIALIWCTRESYGTQSVQLSVAEQEGMLTFLRSLPGNLGADWRQQAALFSRLIPIDSVLPVDLHHALIVPDGWLSSLPFDLIPRPGSPETLLIERFDISYMPTAALLRRPPRREGGVRFPWMPELIAFGDPVIHDSPEAPEDIDNVSGLHALPYSGEEIRSIAAMTHGRNELLLGPLDVKSSFLAHKARGAEILHVSTHAFADADVPEDSRMVFSSEPANGTADYVFLRELYDLDLRGVDLATLSACNTERGKLIRGEGVQAFSRALLFAGSRSALTTLWRVDDQPTSEFMKQFYYFALEKRQSKAEALRSAKLKLLRSGTKLQNPAHWAAFVLNGEGLTKLPRFASWAELLVSSAMLVFLGLGAGFWLTLRIRRRIHRINRA
jgi:CHAT domain-containing protein/tetratricopeptide (TPR) repeat protein